MDSTDLQSLLTIEPVNRTIFFAQFLAGAAPQPQPESASEDPLADNAPAPTTTVRPLAQPTAPGFPA